MADKTKNMFFSEGYFRLFFCVFKLFHFVVPVYPVALYTKKKKRFFYEKHWDCRLTWCISFQEFSYPTLKRRIFHYNYPELFEFLFHEKQRTCLDTPVWAGFYPSKVYLELALQYLERVAIVWEWDVWLVPCIACPQAWLIIVHA